MILALVVMMTMPAFAERVTPETARKVATTFLNNNGAKSTQITDLSKAVGFPNLYIFTTEQSFVVMSADDCVQPILGYSLTGKFVTEGMPENVRGWLQGYSDEIQYAVDSKMKATAETAKMWKDLAEGNAKVGKATVEVDPLIQTKWNQNKYYNNLCPAVSDGPNGHAYTGCVATAMAQIMKYWSYPSTGIGSHSYTWNNQTLSANFGATTYDWEHMEPYYEYYYATGTSGATWLPANYHTTENVAAVATLMYHCGVSINMSYGGQSTGGSSASTAAVVNALKTYFNYSSEMAYKEKSDYSDADWISMVKAELDAHRPLQYRGSTGSGGGHSFVCDGYNSSDYFHFNWGWAGSLDGYFLLSNLNTGANSQSGAGNGNYTNNQAAIFGIQPVQCLASEPTNLTYSLSGLQNLTLNWTAASGAASYNIYCNNNLVGNSTTNTYTGIAPFGTNSYYVRSVDANGVLSLTSNVVTFTVAYQTPIVDDLEATLSGNNVNLSWEAPEWCYPETPSVTLNYGTGNVYYSWTSVYYAHRHLAANLAQYAGKAVYKVSTFIQYPGTYSVYIYTSTQSNQPNPSSLAFSNTGISVTTSNDWYEFITDEPIILTGADDLWVVMKQENTGQTFPTPSFNLSEHNTNAFYAGNSPTSLYDAHSAYNCAWFINTYLTDGTYTYNLYDGSSQVASNINTTSYTINNVANNAAHVYTLKTNYYGGETNASNIVGFALGNASLASLSMSANDHMTVTEGSTLTVSGAITNNGTAANLVIENGAQLVSGPVNGTIFMDITGYTNTNNDYEGYHLIASPVDGIQPGNVTNMTNGTYDLYAWDPNEQLEWRNFEAQGNFTTLDAGLGYLYANLATTTLEFAGQLNANFLGVNNLAYTANDDLHSLNLVGNPYAHQAEFSIANSGSWVNTPNYLTLNPAGDGFIANVASGVKIVLNPMQAVLVQTTAANEGFFEYSDMPPRGDDPELLFDAVRGIVNLKVCNSDGDLVDNAIVRFAEGGIMRKLYLSNNSTRVFIPRGNDEMAIVRSDNERELPVNFKASRNGTYTLSVDNESLGLDYLHLIDNLTGEDVDFLATPSYTFEAKTSDYASRFRLLFAPIGEDADSDNAPFAFISNGNITINQEGTLQIVDMTGRVIMAGDAEHCISTAGMTAGVYVLRLITDEGVKTQKIVIE